jgi:hypothetical protein
MLKQIGRFLVIGSNTNASVFDDGILVERFSDWGEAVNFATARPKGEPLDKLACSPENAGLFRKWLAERDGIVVWQSQDLNDPLASWTTPHLDEDGNLAKSPHWKAPHPSRLIQDASEVEVTVAKAVKTFPVSLKRSGMSMVLTDASRRKIDKEIKAAGPGAFFQNGDLQFPEVTIFAVGKTVALAEFTA